MTYYTEIGWIDMEWLGYDQITLFTTFKSIDMLNSISRRLPQNIFQEGHFIIFDEYPDLKFISWSCFLTANNMTQTNIISMVMTDKFGKILSTTQTHQYDQLWLGSNVDIQNNKNHAHMHCLILKGVWPNLCLKYNSINSILIGIIL